jgi:hypothetical protein
VRYEKLQVNGMENICCIGQVKRWVVTYCRAFLPVGAGHQWHVHPGTENVIS